MRLRRLAALSAAFALLAAPALADEVWNTEIGRVVYLTDIGDVAVFTYPAANGGTGYVYIEGLGGNYTDRSTHRGYWIEPGSSGACSATLTSPDGVSSRAWGRVTVTFARPAAPSGFTAYRGDCFAEPEAMLVGTPVVGGVK